MNMGLMYCSQVLCIHLFFEKYMMIFNPPVMHMYMYVTVIQCYMYMYVTVIQCYMYILH